MFVGLHNHFREGSLLDGLQGVKNVAKRAAELGQPAVAMTDHGTLFGILKFYKACREKNIKPIIGCEIYTCPDRTYKERDVLNKNNHLVLLARNKQGLENLIKIVSDASLTGFYQKPRTDIQFLKEHGRGLIALSACRAGEIPMALERGDYQEAVAVARRMSEIFDEFYLEVEASDTPEQIALNKQIVAMAKDIGLPLVATNDAHYLLKEHAKFHELLLAIQTSDKMSNPNRFRLDSDCYWFKSEEETREYLRMSIGDSDIDEAINNTVKIAEACNVELELGRALFPKVKTPDGMTYEQVLREECYKGLDGFFKKFEVDQKSYKDRLEYELSVIAPAGFSSYFLMLQDLYQEAIRRNIPRGPGRGSAGGSLVSRLLGITMIDPIKHKLQFERFLLPGRVSPPDIDCDFAPSRRKELFQYLVDKYGIEYCCHIGTFGTLNPRLLIRDICRSLEIDLVTADLIAKSVPENINDEDTGDKVHITIENALQESEELRNWAEKYPELFEAARMFEGMPRHTSVHAAGIVVSPVPLFGFLPLMRNKSADDPLPVSQFDMGDVEEWGLIKFDLLGVDALQVIWDAIGDVKTNYGIEIDLELIPFDDKKVYQMVCDLKTFGMFQICTQVGKGMVSQIQPAVFDELVDIAALMRPGPMKTGQDKEYVACKVGMHEISYAHPLLEPILGWSKGCLLYQEQLTAIVRALAGFDFTTSDKLRKAVGKKKPELLIPLKELFLKGCAENKTLTPEQANTMWYVIERQGGYLFNLSHSVAYTYITYWTAWLKAHYPSEFMAATLTTEYSGSGLDRDEKIIEAMFECRNMGLRILPPNVNESKNRFLVCEEDTIRFPLNGAKGVGDKAMEAIIDNSPYESMKDFVDRVPKKNCNKKVVQILILSGAFDWYNPNRVEAMHHFFVLRNEEVAATTKVDKDTTIKLPKEYSFTDRLDWERLILGAYISGHPLDCLQLDSWKYKLPGCLVTVAGKIYSHRKVEIKKGKSIGRDMAICNIDTKEGQLTVVLFPDQFDKFRDKIRKNYIIKVKGRLDERNGEKQVIASEVTIPRIPGFEKQNKKAEHRPCQVCGESLPDGLILVCDKCAADMNKKEGSLSEYGMG